MRILTNQLVVPAWMKVVEAPPATTLPEHTASSNGYPCSVLPAAVQERLRQGTPVSMNECVPVPTGKTFTSSGPG